MGNNRRTGLIDHSVVVSVDGFPAFTNSPYFSRSKFTSTAIPRWIKRWKN
jgi:hypothetical protein